MSRRSSLRVEEPVQVAGSPAGREVDPDVERPGHAPQRPEGQRLDVTPLEQADLRLGRAGLAGELPLGPGTAPPDQPDRVAESEVVHGGEYRDGRFAAGLLRSNIGLVNQCQRIRPESGPIPRQRSTGPISDAESARMQPHSVDLIDLIDI